MIVKEKVLTCSTVISYILFYTVLGINLIYGVEKKRNKFVFFIALCLIFIFMTFNNAGRDIVPYMTAYKQIGEAASLKHALTITYMDKGYALLMFFAHKFGFNFYAFRSVLMLICLTLLVSTIKYYKANPNLIIAIYMGYLFLFDTIQIRNFVAECIILFATRYLLGKRQSVLKYLLCICVATSVHLVSIIYSGFVLVRFIKKKSTYTNIVFCGILLFCVGLFIRPQLGKIVDMVSVLFGGRSAGYQGSTSRFYPIFTAILYLYPIYLMKRWQKTIDSVEVKKRIDYIVRIKSILSILLIACWLNNNYYRIFRNLCMLDAIGLALVYKYSKNNVVAKETLFRLIGIFICWFGGDLFLNRDNAIVSSIFNNNILFQSGNSQTLIAVACIVVAYFLAVGIVRFFRKEVRRGKRTERKYVNNRVNVNV